MHRLPCCSLRKLELILILKSIVSWALIMKMLMFMNKLISNVNQLVEFGIKAITRLKP